MNLSILICTIDQRKMFFNRLIGLLSQIRQPHPDVEILHKSDFAFMSIGEKRNLLVKEAKGKFSVFIDDDDLVDVNYLNTIMPVIRQKDVDGIGFKGLIYPDRLPPKQFIHKHGNNYEEIDGIYYRPLNHLNPVRTDIMRQIPFPHLSHAEDTDYSKRLAESRLIQKPDFIDSYLYFYYYRSQKTEIPKRGKR